MSINPNPAYILYHSDIPAVDCVFTGDLIYTNLNSKTPPQNFGASFVSRTDLDSHTDKVNFPGCSISNNGSQWSRTQLSCVDAQNQGKCTDEATQNHETTDCCCAPEVERCPDGQLTVWKDISGNCYQKGSTRFSWDWCQQRITQYCATPDIASSCVIGTYGYGRIIGDPKTQIKPTSDAVNQQYFAKFVGQCCCPSWPVWCVKDCWPADTANCASGCYNNCQNNACCLEPVQVYDVVNWDNFFPRGPTGNKVKSDINIQYTPLVLNNSVLIPIFDSFNLIAPGLHGQDDGISDGIKLYNYLKSIAENPPIKLPQRMQLYLLVTSYIHAINTSFFRDVYALSYPNTSNLNFLNKNTEYIECIMSNIYLRGPTPIATQTNSIYSLIYKLLGKTQTQTIENVISTQLPLYINLPKPINNNDGTYDIEFTISLEQLLSVGILTPTQSQRTTETYLQKLLPKLANQIIGTMLQDNKGILNGSPGVSPTFMTPNPNLMIASFDWLRNIFIDWTSYNTVNVATDYLIVAAKFRARVHTWSPMLMIFFGQVLDFPADNICKLYPTLPVPINCSKVLKEQSDFLTKTCNYNYITPPKFKGGSISLCPKYNGKIIHPEQFLSLAQSDMCNCLNNGLIPVGVSSPKEAGICFSNTCTDQDRQIFNINNPGQCIQYCDNMWSWLNDKPPLPTSLHPENIDSTRFNTICGGSYTPFKVSQINYKVLIVGIFILLLIIGYILLQNFSQKNIIILITTIILGGIIIFLSIDLAGLSLCITSKTGSYPVKSVCKSKITHLNIPAEFCNYMQPCECYSDQNCGGTCKCVNTLCISNQPNKHRIFSKKTIHRINIIYIVLATILTILLPLYWITFNKIKPLKKPIYIIGLVLLPIIPFSVIGMLYAIPQQITISKKNCK